MTTPSTTTVIGACPHDCPDTCSLVTTVVDGVATKVNGNPAHLHTGGVLCTNPIGASGMLRFAEAAMQVRGTAGDHQIDGVRKAVGHAYGGGSQFFAMWVVGTEKP